MTSGRSATGTAASDVCDCPSSETLLREACLRVSAVLRRLTGRLDSGPSRLSVLPWTERGGVRGEGRGGRSVGRSAAGTNMGVFGGRNWRVPRSGNWEETWGEEGDMVTGVFGSIGGYWGG